MVNRSHGFFLVVLGIAMGLAPLAFVEGHSKGLGLIWNVRNMEVVFHDEVTQGYMEIDEFRDRYPMYNDLPGEELALRLRRKFFSDVPAEPFTREFLGPGELQPREAYAGRTSDPLGLRGEGTDGSTLDPITRSLLTLDAQNHGLVEFSRNKVSFRYAYALFAATAAVLAGLVAIFLRRGRKLL